MNNFMVVVPGLKLLKIEQQKLSDHEKKYFWANYSESPLPYQVKTNSANLEKMRFSAGPTLARPSLARPGLARPGPEPNLFHSCQDCFSGCGYAAATWRNQAIGGLVLSPQARKSCSSGLRWVFASPAYL